MDYKQLATNMIWRARIARYRMEQRLSRIGTRRVLLGNVPATLQTGLVAYWPLTEASGNRADLGRNGYTLTPGAIDPGRNTGKVYDYAAEFSVATDTDVLRSSAEPLRSLQLGSFSIAAWVYPYSFQQALWPYYNYVATCWAGNGRPQGLGYMLFMSNHQTVMFMSSSDGENTVVTHGGYMATANTWYFMSGWFDATPGAMKVGSATNLQNPEVRDYPYTPPASVIANPFTVGHRTDLWAGYSWDGRIGPLMIWNRLLSDAEWLAVYNGGTGLAHPMRPA